MQVWQPEEVNFLANGLSKSTKELYLDFCGMFGDVRSYDSIQKKVRALREAHALLPTEEEEITDVETQIDTMLQEPHPEVDLKIAGVSAVLKRERKELAKEWLQGIVELSEEMKDRLLYYGSRSVVSSDKTSLVVVFSDTHFGKHTKRFNLETARKRMTSVPGRIKEQALPEIDEVVVVLAGDMIEGEDIYPTQNTHIECSAIEQVQVCTDTIWQTLLMFRELFKCRVRVETCPGNHGRVSKTANEKTNWDNVIYHMLRMLATMHGDDKLVVNCNFEPFRTFRVKDRTGLAYHHGVKHTGTSGMREKVAGWISSKQFDFLVHGHWHEWHVGNWLGRFVVGNGCMCGPDDLAERMGVEDDARQAYFFVTPKQPVWGFSFVEWPSDGTAD